MRINRKIKGFTLVEVMITILISSLLFIGLVHTYAQGTRYFNMVLSEFRMYEDTSWFFAQLKKAIEQAESATITANRLTLVHPDVFASHELSGRVQIFYNNRDKTVRMHDYRVGVNNSNKKVLPRYTGNPIGHLRGQDRNKPFEVEEIDFSFFDNMHRFIKVEVIVKNDFDFAGEDIELRQSMSMVYFMYNSVN